MVIATYFSEEKTPKKMPDNLQQIKWRNKILNHENYRCLRLDDKTGEIVAAAFVDDPQALGILLANELLTQGALAILQATLKL